MLRDLGRCHEAVIAFQKVLDIRPNHVAAVNNLGLVLSECDRTEEASAVVNDANHPDEGR